MKLEIIEACSTEELQTKVNAFADSHHIVSLNCQRNLWYEFNADGTRKGDVEKCWTAFVLWTDMPTRRWERGSDG